MKGSSSIRQLVRHPYVLFLVMPAIALNLVAVVLMRGDACCGDRPHSSPPLFGEVEILGADRRGDDVLETRYLVRLHRLAGSAVEEDRMWVRWRDDLLPEGFSLTALGSERGRLSRGDRLFVVMRSPNGCQYEVERFWMSPSRSGPHALDAALL